MLKKINIHHIRNLSQVTVDLSACTLFVGENGSGKTSILESIYLLSRGKTFRHHQPKHYITQGQDTCTVWACNNNDKSFAIAKHKDATTVLKIGGITAQNQATITKQLPCLLIEPASMHILDEGATSRRQLLDWLCFHTDPAFYTAWQDYQKLLKQRNALLKANAHPSQFGAWDTLLSKHAHALHQSRLGVFAKWQDEFGKALTALLPKRCDTLQLSYYAGYDTTTPLKDTLQNRLIADKELGYTRIGGHRADIGIHLQTKDKKEPATHVLSRGEKKLLITALKIAGLPLLCQTTLATPIILIDDIDSELDDNACLSLLQAVLALPCQVFVTSLNTKTADTLQTLLPKDALGLFKIQQGTVCPLG